MYDETAKTKECLSFESLAQELEGISQRSNRIFSFYSKLRFLRLINAGLTNHIEFRNHHHQSFSCA